MGKYSKLYVILLTVVSLVGVPLGTGAMAQGPEEEGDLAAGKMIVDILLVRPLGLVATVAGTALFVASLPFSLMGRNVKAAAKKMVLEPAKFTFVRPLGDL
ncbi:MAG: hypothetical protein V3S89_05025 [Desulfobacterales bacterium]